MEERNLLLVGFKKVTIIKPTSLNALVRIEAIIEEEEDNENI
jgi:hypothetical protein